MDFKNSFSSDQSILVDFSASWCASCQSLDPVLEELTMGLSANRFIKIDTEQHPKIAAAFSVKSIPTLMIFEKGVVKWRHTGVIPRAVLRRTLQKHLKLEDQENNG